MSLSGIVGLLIVLPYPRLFALQPHHILSADIRLVRPLIDPLCDLERLAKL